MTRKRRPRDTTLVASSRPPSPTSRITASAGCSAKARKAAAVVISKNVIGIAGVDALALRQAAPPARLSPIGARLAVGPGELDALVEAHQMRRGVDVHALAGRLQHRLEEGRHRPLAVGAGDMDDRRQAILRIAELGQQRLDAARATGRSAADAAPLTRPGARRSCASGALITYPPWHSPGVGDPLSTRHEAQP